MNQAMLSQLQSRIDKRRNHITYIEQLIADDKAVVKQLRADGDHEGAKGFHQLFVVEAKRDLAEVVREQKLDKRLYGIALGEQQMIAYNRKLTADYHDLQRKAFILALDKIDAEQPVRTITLPAR